MQPIVEFSQQDLNAALSDTGLRFLEFFIQIIPKTGTKLIQNSRLKPAEPGTEQRPHRKESEIPSVFPCVSFPGRNNGKTEHPKKDKQQKKNKNKQTAYFNQNRHHRERQESLHTGRQTTSPTEKRQAEDNI